MAKKKAVKKSTSEEEYGIYYVVNVYDNHGKIVINQTGKPPIGPPPPGGS